ncbi:MAG: Holliday junction resolvase RuvX [Candidatus Marinimicrobia bacterium]|jgi:putative Holliday junction resolvase|nr:Holliday junction resolvase RuvX [Candidatus Neomarinimicrobiota bacterium]MBT3677062.1 Holliday junction resolvase RuvX [Candidatus Neomarinimicrobiota bacterium]MBT3762383.1 Holliday junction resolvase RuvX [Candidatus Neomarinimicrobiota bacterium]MBT4069471.1 Holliday junction resolvase RuvX [Candidatus Neomarinimicrobiota bacterium]MBT4270501.1 Holliday junction resolvase RuvX [Candidatus Neomarinimicrobiota bacterium]
MGRLLGIDHGTKRVGLALSDPLKIIAKPFQTLTYKDFNDLSSQLKSIIIENDIEGIVLGFPIGMQGQRTQQTDKVAEFAELLKYAVDVPIALEDERLSSISAEKSLILQNVKTGHNKGRIDETAAAIFLQQYLDRTR